MVVSESNDGSLVFDCPGCGCAHGVYPRPLKHPHTGASWDWNSDRAKPTFSPSILAKVEFSDRPTKICHFFVTDGSIRYLSDCTHSMAGQTIVMQEVE
jgi:hypothetical protein